MNKNKIFIPKNSIVLLLLLFSSWWGYAQQLTAKVGEAITLSVNEVFNDTYVWELYDQTEGVNFATTLGNCSTEKAQFVNGNTGALVQVKWLQPGTYFYKVTAKSSCSNNIKIGKIIITEANIPPAPQIVITYSCKQGTATLKAKDYKGELLWNTGETTPEITVTTPGVYTLTQTINGTKSKETLITVQEIIPSKPTNVMAIPNIIEEGGVAKLSAQGCENGTLHWYLDAKLTKEIINLEVSPKTTTTYYVVCKNEVGCISSYQEVTLRVETNCDKLFAQMKIPQLVTPNGDGANDTWEIPDLEKYCLQCGKEATVELYNRYGDVVYRKENYMLSNGRFKGISESNKDFMNEYKLPVGTYFYAIYIKGKPIKSGYIYLNY